MAKIIKKKFLNSLPSFLILSLLSLSAAGLIFNFNIEIDKVGNKLGFSISQPEVEANDDTATTTVTVKNAAPAITGEPAESPASATTTPVNIGDSISFVATASDAEGDNFYLLICDQDGADAGAGGGVPSCQNTQFCVSATTTAGTQATCSYTLAANVSETQDWVAYVCDDNSIDADCSAASKNGTGDSGSPFHINHAPTIDAVYTSTNNQDPGEDFTFTATSTDTDIIGGDDVLELSICTTNSWATSTGCAAATLCTGTSTGPNISCSWTSPIPSLDQAYAYYAFVKDDNEMAANGNSQTNTYTVNNVAPSVTSILLNDGNNITLNIKDAPNIAVYASSTTITDNNGCADIVSATGTVYLSSATGGYNCSADDNDCYQIPSGSCVISGCSGGTDTSVEVECNTSLAYYAVPTVAGDNNSHGGENWLASIRAFDESLSYASSTGSAVDVGVSTAIEVTQTLIDYGTLVGGTDTGSDNATTTVVNAGNAPLNTELVGDDMLRNGTGPQYIAASEQEFSLSTFTYGSGTNIASSSQTSVDTVIPRPTSSAGTDDDIYWGIHVPTIISGDYNGLDTFTAALDTNAGAEW